MVSKEEKAEYLNYVADKYDFKDTDAALLFLGIVEEMDLDKFKIVRSVSSKSVKAKRNIIAFATKSISGRSYAYWNNEGILLLNHLDIFRELLSSEEEHFLIINYDKKEEDWRYLAVEEDVFATKRMIKQHLDELDLMNNISYHEIMIDEALKAQDEKLFMEHIKALKKLRLEEV